MKLSNSIRAVGLAAVLANGSCDIEEKIEGAVNPAAEDAIDFLEGLEFDYNEGGRDPLECQSDMAELVCMSDDEALKEIYRIRRRLGVSFGSSGEPECDSN